MPKRSMVAIFGPELECVLFVAAPLAFHRAVWLPAPPQGFQRALHRARCWLGHG